MRRQYHLAVRQAHAQARLSAPVAVLQAVRVLFHRPARPAHAHRAFQAQAALRVQVLALRPLAQVRAVRAANQDQFHFPALHLRLVLRALAHRVLFPAHARPAFHRVRVQALALRVSALLAHHAQARFLRQAPALRAFHRVRVRFHHQAHAFRVLHLALRALALHLYRVCRYRVAVLLSHLHRVAALRFQVAAPVFHFRAAHHLHVPALALLQAAARHGHGVLHAPAQAQNHRQALLAVQAVSALVHRAFLLRVIRNPAIRQCRAIRPARPCRPAHPATAHAA